MNSYRQVTLGILAVLVSIVIVLGSLMMTFVESGMRNAIPLSDTPGASFTPSQTPMPGTPTAVPVTGTPVPSETASVTATFYCTPPAGWEVYVIQPGDTLASLAETYDTTVKKLKAANCLLTNDLIPDTEFYVPQVEPTEPQPTATTYQCGAPYGWVLYTVQSGDTLYSIAQEFGTTVYALQQANCLGGSTVIKVGQKLYVPYHLTSTPYLSPTPADTQPPTITGTPEPPTTPTPVPTPTYTDPSTPTPGLPIPTLLPTLPMTPLPTIDPTLTFLEPLAI